MELIIGILGIPVCMILFLWGFITGIKKERKSLENFLKGEITKREL